MIKRLVVLFACACIVSACATKLAHYEGVDAGYAVATISAKKGTVYSSYRLLYRSRDRMQHGEFYWLQDNMFSSDKPDFEDPNESGEVTALKIMPGEYEIYSFSVFQNGYPSTSTYTPRQEFSIPFTIVPGETVYLGRYLAVATYGENFFGMTVKGGPIFVVSDQQARDVAIAKSELPEIAGAKSVVPTSAQIRPPLFVATPPGI
jgi:hypothetical protein